MKYFKNPYKILSLVLGILLIISLFSKDEQEVVLASVNQTGNKNNALTMMLETDVDSNQYEVATSNEWPKEGYIFNAEMSACERGGKLSWDSENNRVVMASSSADKCYVYFDRYTTVRIINVTTSSVTNNSITLTVEATVGENNISKYYFSSNAGVSYEESDSNIYTFNNLETGTEYNFRVYAVDTNGISSNVYSLKESTLSIVNLVDYIKNTVYTGTDGENGLYYHDGNGSYTNAAQEAGDNSYRFAGANPNNYVCFASDAEVCPNDNLYRIIGVFGDQVKLIKHEYATIIQLGTNGDYNNTYAGAGYDTSYYKGTTSTLSIGVYHWNEANCSVAYNATRYYNVWRYSQLNTVNLNTNYITYLNEMNSKWNNMIETTNWVVGGLTYANVNSSPVKTVYTNEIINPSANAGSTTYSAKIGLMYVSDYGYAASPENWTTNLSSYNNNTNRNNNWMYMGLYEWTITRTSDMMYDVFNVWNAGHMTGNVVNQNILQSIYDAVRPTFYLKSSVVMTSGDGSSQNPYRISL